MNYHEPTPSLGVCPKVAEEPDLKNLELPKTAPFTPGFWPKLLELLSAFNLPKVGESLKTFPHLYALPLVKLLGEDLKSRHSPAAIFSPLDSEGAPGSRYRILVDFRQVAPSSRTPDEPFTHRREFSHK
jgi:hypothetical protein